MLMKKFKTPLLIACILLVAACNKLSNNIVPSPVNQKTKPASLTIVILGSSTAQGFGANPIDSSWAKKLQVAVNKTTLANFINLAYEGYTTYNVLPSNCIIHGKPTPDTARNITKALLYKPNLVLISLPNNDIAANYTNMEILSNFQRLTHVLDSVKVPYIIFGTQPRDFSAATERMQLKTLNDTLKSVYSYHVNDFLMSLSTSTYSIKSTMEYGDGIHLNNAGHTVIFNSTLQHPILKQQLEQ